jgi:hypothetical protein
VSAQHEFALTRRGPAVKRSVLFGRELEIGRLEKLVDRVPERGGALVIGGEPWMRRRTTATLCSSWERTGG